MSAAHDDFFIGWADRIPRGQGGFVASIGAGFLALMLLLALGLAGSMDDAGAGAADGSTGEKVLRGIVTARPYAMLHLPPDAGHPRGHAIMLSVTGKFPVVVPPELEGKGVEAKGWLFRRGSMEMLQMTGEPKPIDFTAPLPTTEALGTWRITGEICDGQCYAGAMRPGNGIAHRACANFCVESGVPPVFVATAPVEGTVFMMMADPAGGPVGAAMYDYIGLRVRLDGAVERRGDVLFFKPDLRTARLP